jgi:thioredoxin-like negative regulator of GroEL
MCALEAEPPVLVFVYGSEWETMCREWDEVAAAYTGGIRLLKVDINAAPALNMKYGVHRFPTILSNVAPRCVGQKTTPQLVQMLNEIGNSLDSIY